MFPLNGLTIFITYFVIFSTTEPLKEDIERRYLVPISYTLWISSNYSNLPEIHSINGNVPGNSTFYQVMQIASGLYPKNFEFEAIEYPNLGHFITSINGYTQDPGNSVYWMLYNLTSFPNPELPPGVSQLSPWGVDSLIIEADKHYLFWLQEYSYPLTP